MTKRYFTYLWKKSYKFILIAFFICLLVYPIAMLVQGKPEVRFFTYGVDKILESGEPYYDYIETEYTYILPTDYLLFLPTILLMVMGYLAPIVAHATFQNKKRCDNLFSLPIQKERQIFLTSAFGFLAALCVWLITALLGFAFSYAVGLNYPVGAFMGYLGSLIAIFIAVYGVTSLSCSLMNGVFDSVLLTAISIAVPFLWIALVVSEFVPRGSDLFLAFTPIYAANEFTEFFQAKMAYSKELLDFLSAHEMDPWYLSYYSPRAFGAWEWVSLAVNLSLGALCYALSAFSWKKVKAEEMQTPSKKWFSYPLGVSLAFFPLFFVLSPFRADDSLPILLLVNAVLIVAYFIAFFIFQRKIKWNKTNLIAFVVTYFSANLLSLILLAQTVTVIYD